MADGLRRCAACRGETSVTAGTILDRTRTPLTSWFAAVWYVVNQKQGVSALGLQRALGLGTYRTAWTWLRKLRRAMVRPGRDLLDAAVEVDETLIGGVKPGKRGRGADGKALVVIAVGRREGGSGRVRTRRIPTASAEILTDFVLDNVARGSEVHTEGWGGYNDIGRYRFEHFRDQRVGLGRSGAHRDARSPPRREPAQALAAGHPPRRRQPRSARLRTRRVYLPLQPPPLPASRPPLLPTYSKVPSRQIRAPTRR